MAAQHGQAAGGPPDAPDVKVGKADGANAKTVAELWAQRTALKGKEVTVKAKVVKVTNGVMGKNWLHVRDGSGAKATKDNDLTVTSDATAKTGDVVDRDRRRLDRQGLRRGLRVSRHHREREAEVAPFELTNGVPSHPMIAPSAFAFSAASGYFYTPDRRGAAA